MRVGDTIAAVCTGSGGAISIIRLSGSAALRLGGEIWSGRRAPGTADERRLLLGKLRDGDGGGGGEPVMAAFMPAPNSYTGEDVVEIHCHGGPRATSRVLRLAIAAGARLADPGEFTFRAFANGKMDLTQAEAVADIITAGSDMALKVAERQIVGDLGAKVAAIRSRLIELLAENESRLDFADEDLDWQPAGAAAAAIDEATAAIRELLATRREGEALREGVNVVIAGRPNVGKSSLLNLLLGRDRAIVADIPGTTRDTVEADTVIRGIPATLVDTAGIRAATDVVESLGVERSVASIENAGVVLWLLDATAAPEEEIAEMRSRLADGANVLAVWNKMDAAPSPPPPSGYRREVRVSTTLKTGLDSLLDAFEEIVWDFPHQSATPAVAVSARHANCLEIALAALPEAGRTLGADEFELASVHLRAAIGELGKIIGAEVEPDLLENIFSRFCVGK